MTNSRRQFYVVLAIMVLAGSVSIMSTDLYAPSLPYLTGHFSTTPELIKLTISLNLVVYGFAQLVYGPLSDRFGRRPVFLTTLLLFVLASFACALATTVEQLIIARVLQGSFAAAEAVICLAVFKDLFTEQEQIKGYAIYGMAIALTPAIAPIIGGYIHVLFGWEYNFYLTGSVGVITAFLIYRFLPESAVPDKNALMLKSILATYKLIGLNRKFMVFGCLTGVSLSAIFVFVTAAPFILIDYFGVQVQHFGYYQAIIVVAFFLGSMAATKLVDRWNSMQILNLGLTFTIAGSILLVGLVFMGGLSTKSLVFAYLFIGFGIGPIFASATSKAMTSVTQSAGSAGAVFGTLEIGLSGLIAVLVSVFHDGTPRPFGAVIGLVAILLIMLGWTANRLEQSALETD
ncbi:MAG: DHA1 family bicyclomycin/chloramphenicol resistance-like MFS transporter [Saprospiraceae bacterium]|jgi:DHA1 family bicyclomycin/chloramphenicol resistance-like MFS transporter